MWFFPLTGKDSSLDHFLEYFLDFSALQWKNHWHDVGVAPFCHGFQGSMSWRQLPRGAGVVHGSLVQQFNICYSLHNNRSALRSCALALGEIRFCGVSPGISRSPSV
ncbi:uncharacterized protein J3R85_003523 [Psidium guajava]|nr:uncharacterized protein J3R85_003523 [Psidium guajava]